MYVCMYVYCLRVFVLGSPLLLGGGGDAGVERLGNND